MRPAERAIEAGTVLAGKYRIEAVLGRGGMGMVYRARHLLLGEDVAIKILRSDVSLDDETRARFVREAQAAVKIKSEHVARILDVGTSEDGVPFMVMEFLQGADLGQMVDTHGAMSAPVAIDLLLQACDAIVEAHSIGTVHRDVKPSNLFVSFRPDQSAIVKVLDFGISKSATGPDMSLTQTQSMLGTPAYMSPEQMRSARSVDARTDIWSLGTVLYELVEARRPFEAGSFSEMCVMVAVDPPARMTLGPQIEPIIARCLAKNPADRYAHVAELMRELAPYAGNVDAANHYVKRAYRTLGFGVPARLESNPSISRGSQPVMPGPTPSAVHGAATAAQSIATPPPAPAVQLPTSTIQDPVPARGSGRWFAIVALVAALGVGATLVAVKAAGDESTGVGSGPGQAHGTTTNGAAAGSDGTAATGSAAAAGPPTATAASGSASAATTGTAAAGTGTSSATTGTGASGSGTTSATTGTSASAGAAESGNATAATTGIATTGSAGSAGGSATTTATATTGTASTGTSAATGSGAKASTTGGATTSGTSASTAAIATGNAGRKPTGSKPVTKPATTNTATTNAAPTTTTTTTTTTPTNATNPPTPPVAKPCGTGGDPFAAPRPCKN